VFCKVLLLDNYELETLLYVKTLKRRVTPIHYSYYVQITEPTKIIGVLLGGVVNQQNKIEDNISSYL